METKIYVISDPLAISFLLDNDLEAFNEYLESYQYLDFGQPHTFATMAEADAFCEAIAHGQDECCPTRYPLRSDEPTDLPFIQAIEQY